MEEHAQAGARVVSAASHGGYPEFEECGTQGAPSEHTIETLRHALTKQPAHKHIYRKVLSFFQQTHTTEEAEAFIAEVPEFTYALQPEGRFVFVLEREGAIEREQPEQQPEAGPNADEAPAVADDGEDAAAQAAGEEYGIVGAVWNITELGCAYLAETDPAPMIHDQVLADSARTVPYLRVLEACAKAPRSLSEVEALIKAFYQENPAAEEVRASVFLDRLERAGGLYWKDKWNITEEGRACLEELS